ncbi:MAG: hypothetical protein LBK29_00695 [Oscillospiraceae bacterium]|jgi:VanZ family protein|nr:hypothetical protein [Oscillospiraceae bacterium]
MAEIMAMPPAPTQVVYERHLLLLDFLLLSLASGGVEKTACPENAKESKTGNKLFKKTHSFSYFSVASAITSNIKDW